MRNHLPAMKDCGLIFETQEGMSVPELVDRATYAEASGYGYILSADHLVSVFGKKGVDSAECWVSLAAIAGKTNKIKFGPLVSPITLRNPALLAKMARTLFSYSSGRLVLGIGVGSHKQEHIAHGYAFPQIETRVEQFKEAINIIRKLTEGKTVDLKGKYFSVHAESLRKPKGKIPLIVGGTHNDLVRAAKRYADEWNFWPPSISLDKYMKIKGYLDLKNNNRELAISLVNSFVIAETERDLFRRVKQYAKYNGLRENLGTIVKKMEQEGVFYGTIDAFASQINDWVGRGVEKFYFKVDDWHDAEMVDELTNALKMASST